MLGSSGDVSVLSDDLDPQKKLVISGGYQIADGDTLRTQEAPAVTEAEKDGTSKNAEGSAKPD